jgi:acetyl esterase
MILKLKIVLMRALVVAATWYKWRGKGETNLTTRKHIIELGSHQIKVRSYHPTGLGPFPLMVFYHGGGFIGFNLQTHDALCRDLCVKTDHVVVSVDYRLAPEHPFPAAPNDCFDALVWSRNNTISLNADPTQISLCGDSAGGNLATVTALRARDELPNLIKRQILIYPVTDHYSSELPSYQQYATGTGLTRDTIIWMLDLYLNGSRAYADASTEQGKVAPLRVADLSGLPPSLVITAELDPLRDDGIFYANKMRDQGIAVTHQHYPDQHHGFVGVEGPTKGHKQAILDIAHWLI